jgi:ABC-type multidrug transport system ATPase subunit
VDDIIAKLSLVKAAGTIIGDVKRRGISGGERKRLAIGCESLDCH